MLGPRYVRFHFSSHIANLELDNLGDRRPKYTSSAATDDLSPEHETQPLICHDPDPSPNDLTARLRSPDRRTRTPSAPRLRQNQNLRYVAAAMEKLENSRLAHFANKIAVPSEPGLTNAQLMLHNFDLKPGQ